ncbi:MAG: hypothetical protein HZC17_09890 [Candidatus Omnitrophica bacterium]|nr:hypothetical protein [Candidatus Omnitrophota bacterium]
MIMRKSDFPEKKPSLNVSEAEYLLEAVMRLKKEMEHIPGPNEGRIQELKEAIRKGTFVTDEMIDEVAAKIAHIFLDSRNE